MSVLLVVLLIARNGRGTSLLAHILRVTLTGGVAAAAIIVWCVLDRFGWRWRSSCRRQWRSRRWR